jgi:hypothetical protein
MSVAMVTIPAWARRFAANTLIYASFAMLWFGSAFGGFTVVGRRALGEDSAVLSAATTVALYAIVGSGFLLPFSLILVAFRSMASVSNNTHAKEVLFSALKVLYFVRAIYSLGSASIKSSCQFPN